MKTDSGTGRTAVAIVEDEREVREGLRYFLGLDERIRVAGSFGRAEDFLAWMAENPEPDIVLMDIHLPGMDGIEATRAVLERHPDLVVLILTIFEEEDKILDSIKAGAKGYILKNTKPEQLLEQILSAKAEGSPISPTVARRILEELRRGGTGKAADYGLTPREREVLRDIVDGLTYRELAERHHIAGSTAKKHILHIYQKLNVSSKAEIVRKALDERLI
ncbi:MAG TPA: response regulator transcription factor [Spirochaetia bacterium]|nr:response regulator transcription factor [Spirochaetales bacterium]HRY80797.1 response regulator transcription factor [Spirochaetia bacterium]HRZ89108.1 response regulator transcription factor [Spirochaetia bacterium]